MSDQNGFHEKQGDFDLVWEDKIPDMPESPEPAAPTLEFTEAGPEAEATAAETEAPAAEKPAVEALSDAPAAVSERLFDAEEPEKAEPDKAEGNKKKEKRGLFGIRKDKAESASVKTADAGAGTGGDTGEDGKGKKKRSSFWLKVKIVLILILILLIAFGVFMYLIPAFNRADNTKVSGSADWMSSLVDTRRISQVTIPGTHDSAARNVELAFFSKCQSLTIEKQLEAGFRYLDIRLAVDEGRLKLMHGFAECKNGSMPWGDDLYLEDVLKQCYSFLDAHPAEFIIFAVKQEHGRESVNEFERLLTSYLMEEPERWLLTNSIPTVGQARGKLVLMRRYDDAAGFGQNAGIALIWDDQGNRKDTAPNIVGKEYSDYSLWVQDRYKYDTDAKWAAFRAGMSSVKADNTNIVIHFLSTNGNKAFGHPYKYAKELNAKFAAEDPDGSGWIIFDFASAKLAEQVYKRNF